MYDKYLPGPLLDAYLGSRMYQILQAIIDSLGQKIAVYDEYLPDLLLGAHLGTWMHQIPRSPVCENKNKSIIRI